MSKLAKNTIYGIEEDEENDQEDRELTDVNVHCLTVPIEVLRKVVDFCTHYVTVEKMDEITFPKQEEREEHQVLVKDIVKHDWYANFCNEEIGMLLALVAAAHSMDIKPLLDLVCLAVAASIHGKSPDILRRMVNVNKKADKVVSS